MCERITVGTSPATLKSSQLKHSWIENEILNKDPDIVVALRRTDLWPALQAFPARADSAIQLAGDIEMGFTPALLVQDGLPLAALPADVREQLRNTLHGLFLSHIDCSALSRELAAAGIGLKNRLMVFLDTWSNENICDEDIRSHWSAVLAAAERARRALGALPRGVVLP